MPLDANDRAFSTFCGLCNRIRRPIGEQRWRWRRFRFCNWCDRANPTEKGSR